MSLTYGLLLLVTGLAIMTFGLFMFYAWLPVIYGLIGFDIGLLLGRFLTGDTGATAILIGIAFAVLLGVGSYALEPYRRIMLGLSGGFLFGLSLAAGFGLDGLLGGILWRIAGDGLRPCRRSDRFTFLRRFCNRDVRLERCSACHGRCSSPSSRGWLVRSRRRRTYAVIDPAGLGHARNILAIQ